MHDGKKKSFFLLILFPSWPYSAEEQGGGVHSLAHQPRVWQEGRVPWQGADTVWEVGRGFSWGSASHPRDGKDELLCPGQGAALLFKPVITQLLHPCHPPWAVSSLCPSLGLWSQIEMKYTSPSPPCFFTVVFAALCSDCFYFVIINFLSLLQFWNPCQGY